MEIESLTSKCNTGMGSTKEVIQIIEKGQHEYDYNKLHYFVGMDVDEFGYINIKVTNNIWEATRFSEYEFPSKIDSLISFLKTCDIYESMEVKYIAITLNYEI